MPEASTSSQLVGDRTRGGGVALMEGSLRTYAWGSRTALAELTGRTSPSAHPEAELWFGAHPGAPSALPDHGTDLLERITADPDGELGGDAAEGRLPFLLKLLAADRALSLQAHPTKEQAVEGFARENAAGLAAGTPDRNYKDDNHKPELLVALTRFEALAGFRPVERTRELLGALGVPELDRYTELLSGVAGESEGLRALVTTWISLPASRRLDLIEAVLEACAALVANAPGTDGSGGSGDAASWMVGPAQAARDLGDQYPGDAGILISLLLNHVVLEPGQALFLSAGKLHAYMHGTGVEIMANSDNVLRGGLTTKHIDVPELMKVVDFTSTPDPVQRPEEDGTFRVPVPEFRLRSVDRSADDTGAGGPVEVEGPAIVLLTSGDAVVGEDVNLSAGQAAWVPASARGVTVRGDGHIFVATVG